MENRKWIGFYGDDFTGSTDAMEALTINGVKTILFLHPPDESILEDNRFKDFQAIGIAGISRALNSEEMENELLPAFKSLKLVNAEVYHYKTCSTFDSSPEIGSIGKAMELGVKVFDAKRFIPLIVGVPVLKRYTVFGNHFATMENETYRLDRHPIMSKHPMTPMNEADLRVHLQNQTALDIQSMNILELSGSLNHINSLLEEKINAGNRNAIILFDVMSDEMLTKIGGVLSMEAAKSPVFTVGSSGVEYALTNAWKESGRFEISSSRWGNLQCAKSMLVVSGSCSAVTEKQIQHSLAQGFYGIKIQSSELLNPETKNEYRQKVIKEAAQQLRNGQDVVIYTALGPNDSSIKITKDRLQDNGLKSTDTSRLLGEQLGKISKSVLQLSNLKRVVVAGGDTSGYVLKELEVVAMEMIKPITPGAPLCKTYSNNSTFDNLEITLKGGQMGSEDFFVKVKNLI